MRAFLCDVCGKQLEKTDVRWYIVSVKATVSKRFNDIRTDDMLINTGEFDICEECFARIKQEVKNDESTLY